MNEDLEKINKLIELNKQLRDIAKKYYKEDYTLFDFYNVKKPNIYDDEILFYQSIAEVLKYVGESTGIKLGKYLKVEIDFWGSNIHFGMYLSNKEIESKLDECVFGSLSGINKFIKKHILEMISLILGDIKYSHTFGSYDLSYIFNNEKEFGKNEYGCYHTFEKEKYEADIKEAKEKIDFLVNLSKNKELIDEIDNLLESYFNLIIKHNKE